MSQFNFVNNIHQVTKNEILIIINCNKMNQRVEKICCFNKCACYIITLIYWIVASTGLTVNLFVNNNYLILLSMIFYVFGLVGLISMICYHICCKSDYTFTSLNDDQV